MNKVPRLLLLEINEFNRELLKDASHGLELLNIKRLLDLHECVVSTNDTYESDWLEPWVQWVSVHTGKESREHGIKHLGDISALKERQVWEVLSDKGISSGVWGVLNGSKGNADNCRFFLPDPWTFSEDAYPEVLDSLLQLPRYMATNRMNISKLRFMAKTFKLFRVLLAPNLLLEFFLQLPGALKMLVRYRGAAFAGFCLIEYMSGLLFLNYWRRYKPDFGVLFINSIAHLQHYYWNGSDYKNNDRLAYGLKYLDRLIGKVFNNLDSGDRLLVVNALSQSNTNQEPEWNTYRPIDHERFLNYSGIPFSSVEPLMSYDALIFFDTEKDKLRAKAVLEGAKTGDKGLFLVEEYRDNDRKLFYRFKYTDRVDTGQRFIINNNKAEFHDHFQKINTRTGKHIQKSSAFSNDENLPEKMDNHEIFNYIQGFFRTTS